MSNPKISAGLLMYQLKDKNLGVFLVHPGGPFFKNNDHVWGIPKGERHDEEDLLTCAKREFSEETGITLPKNAVYRELGSTVNSNGKIVYCWAFENNLPPDFKLQSNPSRFGWPENDRGEFFDIKATFLKILPAQRGFLSRLKAKLMV